MNEQKQLEFAGNLLEEIDEINKMISEKEVAEMAETRTYSCGVVLTIFCC